MNNPFALREQGHLEKVQSPSDVGPGIYYDLSNEAYHAGPGISKSGLDMIAKSPSIYQWNKTAPRHEEKTQALDFGTALHCLLLEPDEFKDRFVVAPWFNRRSPDGREEEKQYLQECKEEGRISITEDDHEKLLIMRDSVMAHPVGRFIFEQEGYNEASIFWTDKDTGELCRVRPDRVLKNVNGSPVLVDVKKVDGLERFKRHVFDFRYHVQAAMYSEGYEAETGDYPLFWFLAVSSSVSAGRYGVDVIQLPPEVMREGSDQFHNDLYLYHQCKQANDWLHITTL